MSYAQSEWEQRTKLAAVYRAFARLGMDDLIYTHLSARVPGPDTHFLINPFGLMYAEVTASNLVKIDLGRFPADRVIDLSTLEKFQFFLRGWTDEREVERLIHWERDAPTTLAERWGEVLILGRGLAPERWFELEEGD